MCVYIYIYYVQAYSANECIFWTIYYSEGVSKYAFPDLKSTNALYMYIYNLTVNLSIFCNNFGRFLEDAGRNSLVPFCSIACNELQIF